MRLSELTTLRLGGPAARYVEAASEEALIDAVTAADAAGEPLLVLAGGSNVVVADEGFPGTVVRDRHAAASRATAPRSRSPPASRGTRSWPTAWPAAWPASSAWPASRARSAPRRSRTSAPTARRWPRRSPPCACSTAPTATVRDAGAGGLRLHLPLERVQARRRAAGWCSRVRFALEASPSARRRSATPSWRAPWASTVGARRAAGRRPRGGAGAAPRQGHGPRPRRPRHRLGAARSSPTRCSTPAPSPRCRPAPRSAWADARRRRWPEADGHVKTSAAWLIERAGFHRGHGNPDGIAISTKHTLALTNRGAARRPSSLALAREIAAGVHDAFGVALVPEPVLVGQRW